MLLTLALTAPTDPLVVTALLAGASLATGFINVVSDAIMVIQARRDTKFGSQDFISTLYLSSGVGGALGCVYGGLMTEYSTPLWLWFGYSFFGLVVSLFACFLNKEAEADADVAEEASDISTSQEDYESRQRIVLEIRGVPREEVREMDIPEREGFGYNLRKNCEAIGRAIIMREIY